MKKLSVILIALLCVTLLVACGGKKNEGLEAAGTYLYNIYKDGKEVTAADYEVVGKVIIDGVTYNVTWTVDSDKVKVETLDNGLVKIDVEEESLEEVTYKLTATITDADGNTTTKEFTRKVPKFGITSWEEYMAAKENDNVVVQGVVVAINSKAAGNTRNHLFLMDTSGKGGYYSYQMDADPVADLGIEIGMTVRVTGPCSPYNGMQEIKGGTATIISKEITQFTPVDITDKFVTGTDFNQFVALPVVIKGVTIGGQDLATATSQYLYFTLNGVEGYVRTYVTDFPTTLTAEDKATIDAAHAAKFGYVADVTGILVTYSGTPYLIPTSVDCFYNYTLPERTDKEKLDLEVGNISIPGNITENTTVTLPLTGSTYNTVTFAWISDNACAVVENGKLVVTLPEEAAKVKLTLTATCGTETTTKEFEIKVDAASTDLYIPENVTAPVKDTAYKFYLAQNNRGEILYFSGAMSGTYLATTNKADAAVDVYLEEVTGGFRLYFLDGETKTYIDAYIYDTANNKVGVQLTANPTCVWTFDAELGVLKTVVAEKTWYLGTYSSYNTMSLSETWRISGEEASKVGVSQFPAYLANLKPAINVPEKVTTPAKDTAYKFYLAQNNRGEILYFSGAMSGTYLATTNKADAAVDVYLEEVTGGFRLYFLDGETKTYINAYIYDTANNKVGIQLTATPTCVWTFDAELGVLKTVVAEKTWYLGTYSSYNTMSLSETWRISGEEASKVGVSQFPAYLATLSLAEVAPENVTTPAKDTAYKFYLAQNNRGETLYFSGAMSGTFLATTNKLSKAVDVYLEEVTGGFRLYFLSGETKTYIDAYIYDTANNKVGIQLTATPTCVWTFDAELGVLKTVVAEKTWYLGTYSNYNTMSLSETWRISGEEASKVGVSQFPAYLATIEIVTDSSDDNTGNENTGNENTGNTTPAANATISFESTANRTSFSAAQQVWEQNGIKVTNDKSASTNDVADYSNPARFYKGSKLTVEYTGMVKIAFVCNNASYAAALQSSIVAATGVTVTVDNATVTVTFASAVNSFVVETLSAQVRVDSIGIYTA